MLGKTTAVKYPFRNCDSYIDLFLTILRNSNVHSGPRKTFMVETFAKIVNVFQPHIGKSSIIDLSQGPKHTSKISFVTSSKSKIISVKYLFLRKVHAKFFTKITASNQCIW